MTKKIISMITLITIVILTPSCTSRKNMDIETFREESKTGEKFKVLSVKKKNGEIINFWPKGPGKIVSNSKSGDVIVGIHIKRVGEAYQKVLISTLLVEIESVTVEKVGGIIYYVLGFFGFLMILFMVILVRWSGWPRGYWW